jgi:hypothetical protein
LRRLKGFIIWLGCTAAYPVVRVLAIVIFNLSLHNSANSGHPSPRKRPNSASFTFGKTFYGPQMVALRVIPHSRPE